MRLEIALLFGTILSACSATSDPEPAPAPVNPVATTESIGSGSGSGSSCGNSAPACNGQCPSGQSCTVTDQGSGPYPYTICGCMTNSTTQY